VGEAFVVPLRGIDAPDSENAEVLIRAVLL